MLQHQLQPSRLLVQMRAVICARHDSLRTEETYLGWVKRFILLHGKRHPRDMGAQDVQQFFAQQVLTHDIGWLHDVVRAKQPQRLPVVLTQDEIAAVLRHLSGIPWIMATLLYGAGLRLMACIRLRVKDLDCAYHHIVVRDGKGQKDRVTMLPQHVKAAFQQHLLDVQHLHTQDLATGGGGVDLPDALECTYSNAIHEWVGPEVLPAAQLSRDPRTGIVRRLHIHTRVLQRAVHTAVRQARIPKPACCHSLRHAFATYLHAAGYDIRTVQALLGHRDVRTTMIYTHMRNRGGRGVKSPADLLGTTL